MIVEAIHATGDVERAVRFVDACTPYAGGRLREMHTKLTRALVDAELDEPRAQAALRGFRAVATEADGIGARLPAALARLGEARVLTGRGDRERALERARDALSRFETIGASRYETITRKLVAQVTDAA